MVHTEEIFSIVRWLAVSSGPMEIRRSYMSNLLLIDSNRNQISTANEKTEKVAGNVRIRIFRVADSWDSASTGCKFNILFCKVYSIVCKRIYFIRPKMTCLTLSRTLDTVASRHV
jgi:hypothetical protein